MKTAVFEQNNNKSSGIDGVPAELFKCSFHVISEFLLKIFNYIYMKGEYPENWGREIIIPIFKGGNLDGPSNYRGITLINIISKIYSTILLNRLTKWCNEHEVINNVQFGFQKGKSTAECIFILNAIITKTLSSKKKLYCAFVDFQLILME